MSRRALELTERDGPNCIWCGGEPWPRDMTVEHLVPRSRGGRTQPENLAVACRRCNRARRSRPVVAYVRELVSEGRNVQLGPLRRALERLAQSPRRVHRDYGRNQARLLDRVPVPELP